VNIDLLPYALRSCLPRLGSQRASLEPVVYAHYRVPDGAWDYYVTEAEPVGRDYELFGFLLGSEREEDWRWTFLRLSELERLLGVVRNQEFVPGRLTDVVALPLSE
jgi:hypothetical protein